MAKRRTGVGKSRRTHSHKTQKRLRVKKEMLAQKASNRRK